MIFLQFDNYAFHDTTLICPINWRIDSCVLSNLNVFHRIQKHRRFHCGCMQSEVYFYRAPYLTAWKRKTDVVFLKYVFAGLIAVLSRQIQAGFHQNN